MVDNRESKIPQRDNKCVFLIALLKITNLSRAGRRGFRCLTCAHTYGDGSLGYPVTKDTLEELLRVQ